MPSEPVRRRRTATSAFGVSRREAHDASGFYRRFTAPVLSADDAIARPAEVAEPFVCGDAREMSTVADRSVALVVTSPPYFAGKTYEEELEADGVPSSYLEYLELLTDVFAECARVLEPGGRIAVNVANLGRKPYRSLSADVIRILQDDLGLLLRGEIVWRKGEGASGSCAWGSYRSATNPVLRDVTERVVVASKGRFDRAGSAKARRDAGLPWESTLGADDFMASTLDVWEIPAESATRVGHPAPFPVELPEQLVRLYTFRDDLVLDPFMGSGSSLVAAARLGRRFVGYDLDPAFVEIARRRVVDALDAAPLEGGDVVSAALRDGKAASRLAADVVAAAGFTVTDRDVRVRRTGVTLSIRATDASGATWWFDVAGPFTSHRGGLQRTEVVWRSLGRAAALREHLDGPLVLLTTALPKRPGEGDTALRAAGPRAFFDAIDLLAPEARMRLEVYAKGGCDTPRPGFWTESELRPR